MIQLYSKIGMQVLISDKQQPSRSHRSTHEAGTAELPVFDLCLLRPCPGTASSLPGIPYSGKWQACWNYLPHPPSGFPLCWSSASSSFHDTTNGHGALVCYVWNHWPLLLQCSMSPSSSNHLGFTGSVVNITPQWYSADDGGGCESVEDGW